MQLGQFSEAAEWARRALLHDPKHIPALRTQAAALALAGHEDEATEAIRTLRSVHPDASISGLRRNPKRFKNSRMLDLFSEGLRKAGLPE